jgi:hypothetical protein
MEPTVVTVEVPIPADSVLRAQLPRVDFADAYAVLLPPDAPTDLDYWLRRVFATPPGWIRGLLTARDRLVGVFGLKSSEQAKATPFPELSRTEREVILGMDDRHLDFRACVHVAPTADGVRVTLGTVVMFHNLLGKLYFLPVRPFHKVIARTMLRDAAHATGGRDRP